MSKRSGSPMVAPVKLSKVAGEWTLNQSTSVDTPTEKPDVSRPAFKPVSAGPKARILQVYVLNYKPRVEASINLNGSLPEVRFASPDSTICITGDEFLQLANCREEWPTKPIFLQDIRLEPLEDESTQFVRYEKNVPNSPTLLPDFLPTDIFHMSKYAVRRLKTKLDVMSKHIFKLMESEPIIHQMFECIVRAYKVEYQRLVSMQPIANHFQDLSRKVEAHVPPSHIVRDFCMNTSGSLWNHYSLLTSALAQKTYILSLL